MSRIELDDRIPVDQPAPAPRRFRRPGAATIVLAIIAAGLCIHGLTATGIEPARLLKAPERTLDFLSRGFPPSSDRLRPLSEAMLETVEMALLGTIFGALLSLPVALLAARNTSPHRAIAFLATSALTAMRAIPDLVWALVFVVSVGLGPLAGILTITVDVVAFAGRFFAERIEEVERGPVEALRATGARRRAVIACAILPTCFPSFTGTTLYSLEKSVRGAVVLGLVGAGGIGVELSTAFELRRFDTAVTIILLILVVVIVVERISSTIRARMLDG
ncbi:MAG: phosphonate ABC transporter, permease protein PhnE [Acidimicrobiales bacterium]